MTIVKTLPFGLLLVGLAGAVPAWAQHPIANMLNWRTSHPQNVMEDFGSRSQAPYREVLLAPNDSVLFVDGGATGGRLLRTTDRGLTWEVRGETRAPRGQLQFFSADQGVVFYDSATTLAPRVRGRVRVTTDGAATWSTPRVAPSGVGRFLSPTEGLVFQIRSDHDLLVYHTTNAGQTWTVLDSLTNLPNLARVSVQRLISAPSSRTAYYFSGDTLARRVVQIALGRHTWRVLPLPTAAAPATNGARRQIEFSSDSVGLVRDESSWTQRIFSTTNGGRTWTLLGAPNITGGANNIFALVNAQYALVHDEFPTQEQNLMRTADGGQTWSYVPMADYTPQPDGPGDLFAIGGSRGNFAFCPTSALVMRPSGVAWAVGGAGRIYFSTNFGNTFTLRSRVLTAEQPRGIAFPDPNHGWVLTLDAPMKTTDGGQTWQRVSLGAQYPFAGQGGGAFPDADTVYVGVNVHATPELLRTTDGGQTWTALSVPTSNTLPQLSFYGGARRGVGIDRVGTVVRTADAGQTWQAAPLGLNPAAVPTGLAWAGPQTLFAAGGPTLFRSNDGGASWQVVTAALPRALGANEKIHSLVFPTPQLGFLTITRQSPSADTLYRTTDGGLTWRAVPGMRGGRLSFISPREGFGFQQFTQNSGRTWQSFTGGPVGGYTTGNINSQTLMIDADNGFRISDDGAPGAYMTPVVRRYSRRLLRTAPLAQTTLTPGGTVNVAFTTRGPFSAAERDFRVELSNPMGRFRPGETTIIGQGTASPVAAQLPTGLPAGTRYRLRVVRADGSLLGLDNGQDLRLAGPTGLVAATARLQPTLFPNPTRDRVTVTFPDGARPGRTVQVLDLAGRVVRTLPAPDANTILGLGGLPAGCYVVRTTLADGPTLSRQLILQP